jgi:hypothetical protein
MELEISREDETFFSTDWGGIECPHCGGSYLHHYGFTSYDRGEDGLITDVIDAGSVIFDQNGKMVLCNDYQDVAGSGLTIKKELSSHSLNPSCRRDGIVIKFWCENCAKVSILCIAQHKGQSLIKWTKISASPVNKKRKTIKPGLRFDVLKRDNYTCQACGAIAGNGTILEIDHIKPFSRGGSDEIDNLQVLCRDCNIGKGVKEQ